MRIFAVALAVLLTATGASVRAAEICSGTAVGPNGSAMLVSIVPAVAGKGLSIVSWAPPARGAVKSPNLLIAFALKDGKLGPPQGMVVGHFVEPAVSASANEGEFFVTVGSGVWRAPWGPLWSLRQRGTAPAGVSALAGYAPIAATAESGEQIHPELLKAVATARSVEVAVRSKAGDLIATRTFDVGDASARDELLARALKAETCRPASPPAPPEAPVWRTGPIPATPTGGPRSPR